MSNYNIINNNTTSLSELITLETNNLEGQKGWTIQTHSAVGIDYILLCANEDADIFPLHKDNNQWFGYVIIGSGELHLGDGVNVTETIHYDTGDIVIFESDTYHGWKSTSPLTKLMFVKPCK